MTMEKVRESTQIGMVDPALKSAWQSMLSTGIYTEQDTAIYESQKRLTPVIGRYAAGDIAMIYQIFMDESQPTEDNRGI